MKNLLLWILLFPAFLRGQENCLNVRHDEPLEANNIGALFSTNGQKFYNGKRYFKVPYLSSDSPSTIYASSPWIGGYRSGKLGIAFQTYTSDQFDFHAGPLGPHAQIVADGCSDFSKIWTVYGQEIMQHIEDYADNQIIDHPWPSIYGWPADGNNYFLQYNGFELPDDHRGGWADFMDLNGDGKYEPDQGEYPAIKIGGNYQIPEEMKWMVFNDAAPHDFSGGVPLGVELQLTAFGFHCTDNSLLNNALFNSYKIINQNDEPITDFYFGHWTDYDLGCPGDDYAGCDTIRNTEFVYNAFSFDGGPGNSLDCGNHIIGYGARIPVQSMTYLSQPMYTFNEILIPSNTPTGCYNMLRGTWPDGTPITAVGNGYNPSQSLPVTRYLYSGDPMDHSQWSQVTVHNTINIKTISSVKLDVLQAYEPGRVDLVYQFHLDTMLSFNLQVGVMRRQVDSLKMLISLGNLSCTSFPFCSRTMQCVWPGDFNRDSIVDNNDLLFWGVMKDASGPKRNGNLSWKAQLADEWVKTTTDGVNYNNGDGDGNGKINTVDLDRYLTHYDYKIPGFEKKDKYSQGDDIKIRSNHFYEDGRLTGLQVKSAHALPPLLGMMFEFEYDTLYYQLRSGTDRQYPLTTNMIIPEGSTIISSNYPIRSLDMHYGFVKTNHGSVNIPTEYVFQNFVNGFELKNGISVADLPDTIVFRIKNISAVDNNGNDLHLGAQPLIILKNQITGVAPVSMTDVNIWPNPCHDSFQVNSDELTDILIYDIHGRLVKRILSSDLNKPVDISSLISGVYVLQVQQSSRIYKLIRQ